MIFAPPLYALDFKVTSCFSSSEVKQCNTNIQGLDFLNALASLKTMFKIKSFSYSCFQDFKISEYKRVLQSVTEYYRVLQSITEYCTVLQSVTMCYRVIQSFTGC